MSIDSVKGPGHVTGVPATQERDDLAKAAPKAEPAAKVELQAQKFQPVVEASRAKLEKADELRLEGIKKAVTEGTFPVNPEKIARAMLEDREFFEGLQNVPGDEK